MKVIDLLQRIANGEIETFYKFKYRNKIVTMDYLLDNYLFLEILNDEIEIIEDTPKEDKKIPKKLKKKKTINGSFEGKTTYIYKYNEYEIGETINEIIDYLDYLKSKGE